LRQENNHRIGYIRLDEFSGHAAEQMKQAIVNLNSQNVDRFVLDLRGNPGGLLDQENEIARMWLNQGTIVKIVDGSGTADQIQANHTALTNRPLAILVDGGSASASEILTGALKDNHRATVVGTQTFGKALVQSVNPLSDGSGVNVTIAHYFTPSGLDINHRGITPDIVSLLTEQQKQELSSHPDELGMPQDTQYERAIQALETK
jgi:carboxyl-terminal processing protease